MQIKETNLNFTYIISAFFLAIGLIIATYIASNVVYEIKTTNVISVAGQVEKKVTSDTAKWTGNFYRENANLSDGVNQMKNDWDAIKKYLLAEGISEKEITVNSMTSTEKQEYVCVKEKDGRETCANKFSGYNFYQDFSVESKNLEKITKLAQDSGLFFAQQGLPFASQKPEYYLDFEKLKKIKFELMAEASANAKQRAEEIAKNIGSHLGALQSASMGIFQITPINSTDFADYGIYDTTTIEKKVSAVLRAKFVLKK